MLKPTARIKYMVKDVTKRFDGRATVYVEPKAYAEVPDGSCLFGGAAMFCGGRMTIEFDDASQADRFKLGAEFNVDITPA